MFYNKKKYLVTIISETKEDFVKVIAYTKKESINMVKDVLVKCPMLGYHNKEYKLKSKKIKGV